MQYGIGICIQSGEMVGAHGPKPAGQWPDIKIFKKYTLLILLPGKMVKTDRGLRHLGCPNPEDYLSNSELVAKKKAAS